MGTEKEEWPDRDKKKVYAWKVTKKNLRRRKK